MNSDGHHIFAADGYVNAKRGNWPYGEVGFVTYVSSNGSKVGLANSITNFNGVVFEPIDEFKGFSKSVFLYGDSLRRANLPGKAIAIILMLFSMVIILPYSSLGC